MPNMKAACQRNLKLLVGQAFLVNVSVALTFVPVTSKSMAIIYQSLLTSMPNMKTVGQRNLKLLVGQAFLFKASVTLNFDPVTSKSLGVIY
jgi:hypothetical protein